MIVNGKGIKKGKASEFQAHGYTYRSPASRYGSEALSVKVATNNNKGIVFAVIAQGYGERKTADVASATSIKAYSDWFLGQLGAGNVGFAESDSIGLRSEWEALQSILRSKAADYAEREQAEVDVLSTVMLVDTISHSLKVLDSIGVGIYRIRESGAELILSPFGKRRLTSGRCETQYPLSLPLNTLKYETVSSPQYLNTPRWLSFSLKDKGQYSNNECREAIYLICTGDIIERSLPEELLRLFRPGTITGLLPAKMRLERLVRYGGTGVNKQGVNTGSAILIRYSP